MALVGSVVSGLLGIGVIAWYVFPFLLPFWENA